MTSNSMDRSTVFSLTPLLNQGYKKPILLEAWVKMASDHTTLATLWPVKSGDASKSMSEACVSSEGAFTRPMTFQA